MNSTLNVLRVGLTCVIGLSVLSACADRMTSLKARRVSCDEYNEFARKNNKPLLCQGQITNQKNDELIEIPEELKNLQANGQFEKGQAPVAVNPGTGPAPAPVEKDNNTHAVKTNETKADEQKPVESAAQPKVIVEGSPQNLTGGYTRAVWIERFNTLIGRKDDSAIKLVKGITVTSGLDKNNQSVVTIQGVIIFNGKPMYLQTSPSAQVVRYDEKMVMPLGVDVRPTLSGEPRVLADELIVTASCLSAEAPCSEFGVVLDFSLKYYKGKDNDERLLAVFKVKSGSSDKQGVNGTGVLDSNLKEAIQTLAEGQKVMSPEGAAPGVPVKEESKKEPTKSDLSKGSQLAADDIAKKVTIAKDAFHAASAAKKAGNAEVAEKEAQKAEQAVKDAEAAQAIVVDWMERLKFSESADTTQVAQADAAIAASATHIADAKNYASGARIEANYAKASSPTTEVAPPAPAPAIEDKPAAADVPSVATPVATDGAEEDLNE